MSVRPATPSDPAGPLLPRLAPLFATMFLGFLTVSLPLPALPLHVGGGLGFGTAVAGLAVGLQSFATILTRPYAGRMVDGRGAKPTLVGGLVTSSVAGWLYLCSLGLTREPSISLGVLLLGRLVLGMGESLLITGVLSWAIVRAGTGRSGRAMSWNGMAQYGALACGAPIGFALYKTYGFVSVALGTALLPLLAIAIILPLEPVAASGGSRMPLRSVLGLIWLPGTGLMLAGIGFASVSTFATLDFADKGWAGAGYALSAYGVCFVAVRAFAGGLPDRFGGATVAAVSMVVEASGQLLLWLATDPAAALLGAGLTGLGCSLMFPALGIEAFRRVPPESRGIAVGSFAAFQDLAIGATGPVLGIIAAQHRPSSVFIVGALAAAVGIVVAYRLHASAIPAKTVA